MTRGLRFTRGHFCKEGVLLPGRFAVCGSAAPEGTRGQRRREKVSPKCCQSQSRTVGASLRRSPAPRAASPGQSTPGLQTHAPGLWATGPHHGRRVISGSRTSKERPWEGIEDAPRGKRKQNVHQGRIRQRGTWATTRRDISKVAARWQGDVTNRMR